MQETEEGEEVVMASNGLVVSHGASVTEKNEIYAIIYRIVLIWLIIYLYLFILFQQLNKMNE